MTLRAPFPYFGGKSRVASEIWARLGSPACYVEPFAGSLSVLLNRPQWRPSVSWRETVNDLDGLVTNVWRSIRLRPDDVAKYCDWPISELDLHARHVWLAKSADRIAELLTDPEWCDPKAAGWWIWGASQWIGGEWGRGRYHRRPQVSGWCQGRGVHSARVREQLPKVMHTLASRLRCVRVVCGDWSRLLTATPLNPGRHGATAVFLDPPYDRSTGRNPYTYRCEKYCTADVRAWAIEHADNPRLRIALCGLEAEHDELLAAGWSVLRWTSMQGAEHAESIWFSPHCLSAHAPLFAACEEVAA